MSLYFIFFTSSFQSYNHLFQLSWKIIDAIIIYDTVMVPTLRTIMNSFYYYEYRKNIHLGVKCYGTYLTDYNELFLLLWMLGEYSSRC